MFEVEGDMPENNLPSNSPRRAHNEQQPEPLLAVVPRGTTKLYTVLVSLRNERNGARDHLAGSAASVSYIGNREQVWTWARESDQRALDANRELEQQEN